MESIALPNRLARAAGVVFSLGLLLAGALPLRAQQNEIISFAGTIDQSLSAGRAVPNGAPVDGTLFFVDSNTVPIMSNASQTVYTNASATVKFNINGTSSTFQGFGAMVNLDVVDSSGLAIPCDRLFIHWGPGLANSIIIYSKLTNIVNSAQAGVTNSQWWANRLPYPVDHVISVNDTLAPLIAYGRPPTLTISQTNGYEVVSYPTNADGYTLEYTTALTTNTLAFWQVVTNLPVASGTNWTVIVSNEPPIRFFRLGTLN